VISPLTFECLAEFEGITEDEVEIELTAYNQTIISTPIKILTPTLAVTNLWPNKIPHIVS
jgi:hypothetical protein